MNNILKIKKLHPQAVIPSKGSKDSAGLDLYYHQKQEIIIEPKEIKIIPTGIAMMIPKGYEGQIRPRSGLAVKHGITVLNSPGTIDADYRGEIKVILINHGENKFHITQNMRIAQIIISEYKEMDLKEVNILDDTCRGEGGFGSTGK